MYSEYTHLSKNDIFSAEPLAKDGQHWPVLPRIDTPGLQKVIDVWPHITDIGTKILTYMY